MTSAHEQAAQLMANAEGDRKRTRVKPFRTVYDMLVMFTFLAAAVVLILAFVVIISRQHTIDHLRTQIDTQSEVTACRATMTNVVNERQQRASSALNELVVMITTQSISDKPPDLHAFQAAIENLHLKDAQADSAVNMRSAWIAEGSLVPCPIEP
jgi:hypothetical protein